MKHVQFIIANLIFIIVLVVILIPVLMLQLKVTPEDEAWGLGFIIFPAALGFLIVGIWLILLGAGYRISLFNKLLPFIAIPAMLLPFVFNLPWLINILIESLLILLAIVVTANNIIWHRRDDRQAVETSKHYQSLTRDEIVAKWKNRDKKDTGIGG